MRQRLTPNGRDVSSVQGLRVQYPGWREEMLVNSSGSQGQGRRFQGPSVGEAARRIGILLRANRAFFPLRRIRQDGDWS